MSSPTTRNRLLKQDTGSNTNTWGDEQSTGDFDMIDIALDGVTQLTISGPVTLTSTNYVADQARGRALKILSASTVASTITIPALEKWYLVWNASTYDQIVASSGGGTSVTVKAGEMVSVLCDAVNVKRLTLYALSNALDMGSNKITSLANGTNPADAVNYAQMNAAISAAAFSAGTFGVPITGSDSGKVLTNNGSTPSWAYAVNAGAGLASVSNATVTVTAAVASDVQVGTNTTKAVTAGALGGSMAFGTVPYASTITYDVGTYGYNVACTLTGNATLGQITGLLDGEPIVFDPIQDGTGGRTLAYNATYHDFGAVGVPTLSTGANKRDGLVGQYKSATGKIHWKFAKSA